MGFQGVAVELQTEKSKLVSVKPRTGKFLVHRTSRRDRVWSKLIEIREELRPRMHQSIPVQGKWLRQVVRAWFNYHALPTTSPALS